MDTVGLFFRSLNRFEGISDQNSVYAQNVFSWV